MKKSSNARHWLTLAACCGLTASSIGIFTNSVGVFYSPVSDSLGVGRGAFAMHATLATLAMAFLAPLSARLLPKLPLRLYLGLGMVLGVGSTALMAFSKSIWAFYLLGPLKGAGVAFFGILPVTAVISNWFQKSYGLAVGAALSFSGLSGAVFSPLFTFIIEKAGWQAAFLWMAGLGLVLALPGVLTLRLTPQEVSLAPYGGSVAVAMPDIRENRPKAKLYMPALVLACTFSLLACAITSVGQHFPTVAEAAGLSAQVGAMMVSAGMVGNIISKLAIGILSDHKGPFFANGCMLLVNGLSMGVMLLLSPVLPAVAIGAAFFYGAVYSVGAAGIPLLTRGVFGPEQYTAAYSIVSVFSNIGSASALTIIGLVYDLTGSCVPVLLGAIAIQAANLAMLVFLSRQRGRSSARLAS